MAYEFTGIFRYSLKEVSISLAYGLVHNGIAVTSANGKRLDKRSVIALLDKTIYTNDCQEVASLSVYTRESYTRKGDTHTNKAAKAAFNRDRYSDYPVCVHVSAVKRLSFDL